MSFLAKIVSVLTADIRTTLISLVIGFVVYKFAKFYVKVFSLPPGPMPLPFVGNILSFRGTKDHWSAVLEEVADKYGPIFTIWMGSTPIVLISDIEIGKEVFRKNEFASRATTMFSTLLSNEERTDIVSAEYGPRWEALRRVAHSAVLKYSSTDKLMYLVSDCVDHTVETIVEKEGLNNPFDPSEYIYNNFLNILANSAFGKRYELDDPEYQSLRYLQRDLIKENSTRFLFWEFFPIITKIDFKRYNEMVNGLTGSIDLIRNKYKSHYKDYDESVVRDFSDTLISAKNDALREGKESAPYLTDENLSMAIVDLFLAGTDTSQRTFLWIVFLMTYYPEVQKKLKEEIETQIGDRIPTQEDRDRCHYVMAVIAETLRLRNIVPLGVNHTPVVPSKLGGYTITEDVQISVFQGHILHNEKHWEKPLEFKPERFLDNGKYITTRPKAFIPFGIGRRVCLGEKLALVDLFLALVRFIQSTSEYDIVLHYDGPDSKPDPNNMMEYTPRHFEISFNDRKN